MKLLNDLYMRKKRKDGNSEKNESDEKKNGSETGEKHKYKKRMKKVQDSKKREHKG